MAKAPRGGNVPVSYFSAANTRKGSSALSLATQSSFPNPSAYDLGADKNFFFIIKRSGGGHGLCIPRENASNKAAHPTVF